MDFYEISVKEKSRGVDIIYPEFIYDNCTDIVCKGSTMYAFWDGEKWDTKLHHLIAKIDADTRAKKKELQISKPDVRYETLMMRKASSGIRESFEKYLKLSVESNVAFNRKILFADSEIKKSDYATGRLNYTPAPGSTESFDTLIDVLYAPSEKEKILWFMGALLTNNMERIQKFLFLYGGKGTGKGTIIEIFKMMFEGYHQPIDLHELTGQGAFATGQVQEVPLLIDSDTDLSKITKDTNLLKLVSHEPLIINKKFQSTYEIRFTGLLLAASNQRYKSANVDAGINRRAVVAEPTSHRVPGNVYFELFDKIPYEIPAIAYKAIQTFESLGAQYYNEYVDKDMLQATDIMYDFVSEYYNELGDMVSLRQATELYLEYLEENGYEAKGAKRKLRTELQRYYREFLRDTHIDGVKVKNVYKGLKYEIFSDSDTISHEEVNVSVKADEWCWIDLKPQESIFDKDCAECQAQYADTKGFPSYKWDNVVTKLKNINTHSLHYVRVPDNLIVIDLDLKDETGEKNFELNLNRANKFPRTYVETSKSGKGIHLHYWYDGDVSQLAREVEEDVEIKVYTGKSALRRQLTICNNIPIAHISTGLPLREGDNMYIGKVKDMVWNEKNLTTIIQNNLRRKYHSNTKPSIDYIASALEAAEKQGLKYDLRDMQNAVTIFASQSTHNSKYCLERVSKMNFCTIDENKDEKEVTHLSSINDEKKINTEDLYFFDIEVFPNMNMVVYKKYKQDCIVLLNPNKNQIEELLTHPLVGFNNRDYDNQILYAMLKGKSAGAIYELSHDIVKGGHKKLSPVAKELSYADIYDYASTKQSLKKWEIEMAENGIEVSHDEFEYNFDQPLDESLWERCAEYCKHDVEATEKLFEYIMPDFIARKILSELSGLSVNTPTRQHTGNIIFGDDYSPQDKFNYPDLSETFPGYKYELTEKGIVSHYMGEETSEGGYVYSEPGIYENVALLDVASLHPSSLIAMNYFGPYTKNFADIKQARIYIKHKDFDKAKTLFNGKLAPYLVDEHIAKALSQALKIVINSVYGYTSATFPNRFKHPKNVDNVVAKRGALFMVKLKHEVQALGYKVAHIKTDSIKIPDADEFIINFVMEFGKKYGYDFELEHTYKKMALVNKSTYIAQLEDDSWSATGAQFAVPYVFKTLFTNEKIENDDLFITKEVKDSSIYIGDEFIGKIARVYPSLTGDEMWRVVNDKRGYVNGTKGYKWKQASEFTNISDVDISYFNNLVIDSIKAINKVGVSSHIIDTTTLPSDLIDYIRFY